MNYYGQEYYRTSLFSYCENVVKREEIIEKVNKIKELFPIRKEEKALILFENGAKWIGVDCDSIQQQVHLDIIKQCTRIMGMPVILYDIFERCVITIGFGDNQKDICQIGYSNDALDNDETMLEFPKGLLHFFRGKEQDVLDTWEEDFVWEEEKLYQIFKYMTQDVIPQYMLGKRKLTDIPLGVNRILC